LRKITGGNIRINWWIGNGNEAWAGSMFRRNPLRTFQKNQPAANSRESGQQRGWLAAGEISEITWKSAKPALQTRETKKIDEK
jgi:hypothetical protein